VPEEAESRHERPRGYPYDAETPQEAQAAAILAAYPQEIEPGPADWATTGIQYFVRRDYLVAEEEYADRVRRVLGDVVANPDRDDNDDDRERPDPDAPADGAVTYGIEWIRLRPGVGAHRAMDLLDQRGLLARLPEEAVNFEYVVHIAPINTGTICPADEPEPVYSDTPLDPPVAGDRRAGAGVRVVVVDTGLDRPTALAHSWMAGVIGDPDPGVLPVNPNNPKQSNLKTYAGHGTFIAGLIRCVAPAAEVTVRAAFPPSGTAYAAKPLGLTFEWQMVRSLAQTLDDDHPDVISLSAGTRAQHGRRLTVIHRFWERKLSRYKGVVLVAAAGNDRRRTPFHPAADKWAVSAGALSANLRNRASFSNYGAWVDAYAPGESLVSAFPNGQLDYHEPPRKGNVGVFTTGLARWSGTSFATPILAGLIAARMSRTGEGGPDAARSMIDEARRTAIPGVGAVALPDYGTP